VCSVFGLKEASEKEETATHSLALIKKGGKGKRGDQCQKKRTTPKVKPQPPILKGGRREGERRILVHVDKEKRGRTKNKKKKKGGPADFSKGSGEAQHSPGGLQPSGEKKRPGILKGK